MLFLCQYKQLQEEQPERNWVTFYKSVILSQLLPPNIQKVMLVSFALHLTEIKVLSFQYKGAREKDLSSTEDVHRSYSVVTCVEMLEIKMDIS